MTNFKAISKQLEMGCKALNITKQQAMDILQQEAAQQGNEARLEFLWLYESKYLNS